MENYIVYCGDVNYSTGADLTVTTEGGGEAKLIGGMSFRDPFTMAAPGDTDHLLQIYQPTKPGKFGLHATVSIPWAPEGNEETADGYYLIADDLTVTPITAEDMDKHTDPIPVPAVSGDVNADGDVDVLDLITLQKYVLGTGTLPAADAADLNEDGSVDVFDLALLKRVLLSKQQEQPEEEVSISFTANHKTTGGIIDHSKYENQSPAATIVTTYSDYQAAVEKDANSLRQVPDEAFFETKALVVVETESTSSSVYHEVTAMTRKADTLNINLLKRTPESVNEDLVARRLCYIVDKNDLAGVTKTNITTEEVMTKQIKATNMTSSDYGTVSRNTELPEKGSFVLLNTYEEFTAAAAGLDLINVPDEAFFETKSVALVTSPATSSSYRIRLTGMQLEGNTLTAYLYGQSYGMPTPDMANQTFVYSVNKADIQGASEFKVDLNTTIIEDPTVDY
ncbi:MAG: dockerin type I repeat-containing protein [Oscillospiraceae bacterium]|nr:dockerin type I repeat-containing protein [Oscillospiraceae bacterium]